MSKTVFATASLLSLALFTAVQAQLPDDLPPADEAEVLTSGPVHEAFAEQYNPNPSEGIIIKQKPPADIEEIPPDQRPEGDNVAWIPGYWGYDEDRSDFIWISGLWRNVPPGQRWVPGYWAEVDQGYQWVPGFWADDSSDQVSYLPAPPQTLEAGPNIASPGSNYFWVPGTWQYASSRYQWRPGFWSPAYTNWMWIPARYLWTPRGYLYQSGYWDYRIPYRGVLFAPMYVYPRYYARPYRLIPRIALNTTRLLLYLFVRPRYCHYYFGNYYNPVYASRWGISPWYSYQRRHYYDPLFSYYNWFYGRQGYNYYNVMNSWNQRLLTNNNLLPQRTYRAERQFLAQNQGNTTLNQVALAQTLGELSASRRSDNQLARMVANTGDHWRQNTQMVRNVEQLRRGFERAGNIPGGDRSNTLGRATDALRNGAATRGGQPRAGNLADQVARGTLQLPRVERRSSQALAGDARNRPPRSAEASGRDNFRQSDRSGPRFPSSLNRGPTTGSTPSARAPGQVTPRNDPRRTRPTDITRNPSSPARGPTAAPGPRPSNSRTTSPPRTQRPATSPVPRSQPSRTDRSRPTIQTAPRSAPPIEFRSEPPRTQSRSQPPRSSNSRPPTTRAPIIRNPSPAPSTRSQPRTQSRPAPAPSTRSQPRTQIRPTPPPSTRSQPRLQSRPAPARSPAPSVRSPSRPPSGSGSRAPAPSIRAPSRGRTAAPPPSRSRSAAPPSSRGRSSAPPSSRGRSSAPAPSRGRSSSPAPSRGSGPSSGSHGRSR